MELYKRIPANSYRNTGLYHHGEFCSNCGQNESEDLPRNVVMHKRRTRIYEKHCPSCHCPPERRRFSSPGKPRTLENVEAMINQCERVFTEPISSTIKKSQSSPLTQKLYWHDYQTDAHPRCTKRPLQTRRQRRFEYDKYLFRMKGDAANSELTNEDIVACSKYARAIPVKSSLKKHHRCKQPERSPDERECSDAESEVSVKYIPRAVQSRKSRVLDPELRCRYVGIGDGEYVAETKNESDVESQEMRNLVLNLEDLEKLKRGDGGATISEDDKRLEKRRPENVARMVKSRKTGDAASKSSTLIGQSINRRTKELVLNEPERLAKLDLHATKTRILESIDRMLDTTDNTKNDVPVQHEQTEPESLEKITRELQENGWQLLFNGLTIHRDSTSRRIVRLDCLNHIRQQLDKLYALESTLDNCPPKLQSLSSCDMPRNEERQQSQHQLEQKTADS
ncbi:hypothetical protein ALC56_10838 [Trachymyrmex septentrionalis]|uniref:Uncharacterized protein n=1 Tax=Trachymyrmex septentrionalis TaxID=34720 RepID=A0A195F2R9_9HYME|nr:PREDICTED: uncharacterized protein LOC108752252 [Trachymyrmex septentrionalis]KYN34870.1 hypothetical protein ALC56_10838 [Trachymyrmex septentrionalis]